MNTRRLLGALCAGTLAFSLSNSAHAAFVIDDFNVNSFSSVSDNTVGGPVTGPSVIDLRDRVGLSRTFSIFAPDHPFVRPIGRTGAASAGLLLLHKLSGSLLRSRYSPNIRLRLEPGNKC
jgi:hypothetical protein